MITVVIGLSLVAERASETEIVFFSAGITREDKMSRDGILIALHQECTQRRTYETGCRLDDGTFNRIHWDASLADGGAVARVGASGEFVELIHQVEGRTTIDLLPLHRASDVRYFSAGIGLEERAAQYPHFSLKLVFTAGGKPFLSGVSVTIQPVKGGAALTISQEQVEGPWLFVDLAPGVYDVTAIHGDRKQWLTGIVVEAGKQKTIHLRWSEDRSLAGVVPPE